MKTLPTPQGEQIATSYRFQRDAADAMVEAWEASEASDRAERVATGVLPWIGDRTPQALISLGTRRLYNDPTSPRPSSSSSSSITDLEGSTPIACVEWNRITVYREAATSNKTRRPRMESLKNLTRGSFNGYISPATRRKIRKPVSTWIRSIWIYRADVKRKWDPGRAYPVFMTLTLPSKQVHSDQEVNRKCLMPFIQRLKRDYEIEHYFYRAEAQENGNVHYHLLTDRYVPAKYVQMAWNMSCEALGYLSAYYEATGSIYPPSTEIHRLRDKVKDKKTGQWKTVDPIDYLLDYLMDMPEMESGSDQEQGEEPKERKLVGKYRDEEGEIRTYVTRPISGRVWGMSDGLREIREPRCEVTVDLVNVLEEERQAGKLRRVDNEHATMYFGKVSVILGRRRPGVWKLMKEYYLQVFGSLYPDQLPKHYVERYGRKEVSNLWVDLEAVALYNRLKVEADGVSFETAAELERWMDQQAKRTTTGKKQAA